MIESNLPREESFMLCRSSCLHLNRDAGGTQYLRLQAKATGHNYTVASYVPVRIPTRQQGCQEWCGDKRQVDGLMRESHRHEQCATIGRPGLQGT